jgi:hypothetical protein
VQLEKEIGKSWLTQFIDNWTVMESFGQQVDPKVETKFLIKTEFIRGYLFSFYQ